MILDTTQQCPICGRPYVVHSHYCGDQSKCSGCRKAEQEALRRPDTQEEISRRKEYFGNE